MKSAADASPGVPPADGTLWLNEAETPLAVDLYHSLISGGPASLANAGALLKLAPELPSAVDIEIPAIEDPTLRIVIRLHGPDDWRPFIPLTTTLTHELIERAGEVDDVAWQLKRPPEVRAMTRREREELGGDLSEIAAAIKSAAHRLYGAHTASPWRPIPAGAIVVGLWAVCSPVPKGAAH